MNISRNKTDMGHDRQYKELGEKEERETAERLRHTRLKEGLSEGQSNFTDKQRREMIEDAKKIEEEYGPEIAGKDSYEITDDMTKKGKEKDPERFTPPRFLR